MHDDSTYKRELQLEGREVLTVSEITSRIKDNMERCFSDVCVQAEISQFTLAASGHLYMTLKDDKAVLRSVVWRSVLKNVQFEIAEGLEVVCLGSVDVYPPRGSYQLIVKKIYPCGAGSLQIAFRQLVERLKKEGLFDESHKKTLPFFPRKIGIITSGTGAAVQDMMRIISRRWPVADIYILPTLVQGEESAPDIVKSIKLFNQKRPDMDVLIVGRGGGSLEDLMAFNDERVARAIFESFIPVVSAVGHEIDFTVSDFVADMRAATPSEAAETVVPDLSEMVSKVNQLSRRLARALRNKLETSRRRLSSCRQRYVLKHPEALIQNRVQRTDELRENLDFAVKRRVDLAGQKLESLKKQLEGLSPVGVLERGYSITMGRDGKPVHSTEGLLEGDTIQTRLARGRILSLIQSVSSGEENIDSR